MASRNALLEAANAVLGRPQSQYVPPLPLPQEYNAIMSQYYPKTAGEAVGGGMAGAVLDYGPIPAQVVTDVAMQPVRAGDALANAVIDPTVPKITNAGMQSALALLQPGKAAGILGGGYLTALAQDAGAFDWSANAEPYKERPFSEMPLPESGKIPRAEYNLGDSMDRKREEAMIAAEAQARVEAAKAAAAERARAEGAVIQGDAAAKRDERSAVMARANSAYDTEIAKKRSFSETALGKLYDETGGAAAFLAPIAAGAISRAATGPGKGVLDNYARPYLEGVVAAYGANSLPLYYDAYHTETYNPELAAMQAYIREAPEDDPRRQRYVQAIEDTNPPTQNPIQAEARQQLQDGFLSRMGTSAVEGLGGLLGHSMANIPRRALSKVPVAAEAAGQAPGRVMTGYYDGMTSATNSQNRMLRAQAQRPADAPQSPSPSGPSGTQATQPAGPALGQQGPQPGPQPVPPKRPPATGQTGRGGSSVQQPSRNPPANRQKEILDEMVAGTAQPASKQEQNYINKLTRQAEGMAESLGISKEDALRAMNDTIKSGARNTPYAVPAGVAGAAAYGLAPEQSQSAPFDFEQALQSYGQLVMDMDGNGIIDERDYALMQQR